MFGLLISVKSDRPTSLLTHVSNALGQQSTGRMLAVSTPWSGNTENKSFFLPKKQKTENKKRIKPDAVDCPIDGAETIDSITWQTKTTCQDKHDRPIKATKKGSKKPEKQKSQKEKTSQNIMANSACEGMSTMLWGL